MIEQKALQVKNGLTSIHGDLNYLKYLKKHKVEQLTEIV